MLLDLSELFVCPRCRPTQGLVVLVDEIRDRRVVRGRLGCPRCEARYPVEGGTIRLDVDAEPEAAGPGAPRGEEAADRGPGTAAEDRPEPSGAALFRGASESEAGLRLGALLGLPEAEGPFLLFPGLGALALPLAEAAEGEEVLALDAPPDAADRGAAEGAGRRVVRVVGADPADLPLFPGRVGGAALTGGPPGAVGEAVRTVREGGRLVVVEPDPEVADAVADLPVEVVAREARALVGVRRS